tara:strand:- start:124 stop:480 length:357 start_codon:yes stop_codon:yes gene_type:complete
MVLLGLPVHHVVLMPTVLFLFAGLSLAIFKGFLALVKNAAEGIYNDIGIVQTLQPFLRHFDSVLFEAFGKASKIKINLTAIALTAIVIVLMAIKVSIDQLRADVRAAARDVARARKEQ